MSKGRFPEKSSCSFIFCPNEWGREGPAQIFCPFFTNCIIGQFGDGDGEIPAQIKKSGTSCPNWGEGGGRGNLDKIQKNSYLFP